MITERRRASPRDWGQPAEAEALYREVRSAFLSLEKAYDAALVVSPDLAALLAEQERTANLKPLAAEIVAAFGARGVDRDRSRSLANSMKQSSSAGTLALELSFMPSQ